MAVGLLYGIKIAILVTHGFEQQEMVLPCKALQDVGAVVHLIAPDAGKVKGWHWDKPIPGDDFDVDKTLDEACSNDYDALVLPGGYAPDDLRSNEKAIAFIKGFAQKPIAAICHGAWPLIDAELVAGKTLTSWPSIKKDLINAGATWVDCECVRDRLLITSRMPDDIPAFNEAMIDLLSKKEKKAYVVHCIVEAKSGKETELREELLKVVEPSRDESTCLEYRLHQDEQNPAVFMLYERWESKEAHALQFQKPYIIALVHKLGDLLAKPYLAFFSHKI